MISKRTATRPDVLFQSERADRTRCWLAQGAGRPARKA